MDIDGGGGINGLGRGGQEDTLPSAPKCLQGCLTAKAPLTEKPTPRRSQALVNPSGLGRTGRGKGQLLPPPSRRGIGEAE